MRAEGHGGADESESAAASSFSGETLGAAEQREHGAQLEERVHAQFLRVPDVEGCDGVQGDRQCPRRPLEPRPRERRKREQGEAREQGREEPHDASVGSEALDPRSVRSETQRWMAVRVQQLQSVGRGREPGRVTFVEPQRVHFETREAQPEADQDWERGQRS